MITHSLVDPFHLIAKQNKGNPLWLHRIPFGQEVFFMPHTKRQGNAVFLCSPGFFKVFALAPWVPLRCVDCFLYDCFHKGGWERDGLRALERDGETRLSSKLNDSLEQFFSVIIPFPGLEVRCFLCLSLLIELSKNNKIILSASSLFFTLFSTVFTHLCQLVCHEVETSVFCVTRFHFSVSFAN